jgi:deoxyhypusine synthase
MDQFNIDSHDVSKYEDVTKFLAYTGARVKNGEEAVMNSEITKYLTHIGIVTSGPLTAESIRAAEVSKRASIEKEAIENQKKNIDQTLL